MVILTELLPESSSSSFSSTNNHNQLYVYDVFLSFRGEDTRNHFTDHLYNSLVDANITTFLDDEDIETGQQLKPELESAIRSSRASVIVLSKNYAFSTWCLDELVLIMEQHKKYKQIVIPIFYDVEPTHVRKQQSSFYIAMEKHKHRVEALTDPEKRCDLGRMIESWKKALTEVADLKGKDAKGRKERELIEEVVTDIHRRLGVLLNNNLPRLIGVDHYAEFIRRWLTDRSCHTGDILTVAGMGGIGKTSLAKYVYQLHYGKFDKYAFIEGIDRRCNERYGLLDLQKQLHGNLSKKLQLQVNDVSVYTSKIENVLSRKRVFIVLDDIGSLDQLDALLGNKGLQPGSKVVITTKDASLTARCALFSSEAQPKHTPVLLNGLWESDSLELLCIHAFKSQKPKEDYKDVSEKLVKYCKGHPLALEVLGRSLQNREVAYWGECVKGLKKEPHSRVKESLKMSIDSLPSENDKELFKHIACFFVGMDRDVTEIILTACDINTRSGIAHLTERCLLSINEKNKLEMNSLIQEMGRYLVRQESPEKPWKRSRLWCHEESFKVLKQTKGNRSLVGLALDMRMLDKKKSHRSFELKTESFSQMDNLMLLQLNYVPLNGHFENFPDKLRWLCMHGSPLKFIHLDIPMENLTALDMSYSKIESFDMSCSNPQPLAKWQKGLTGSSSKDNRLLVSLKILDLSFCEQLHSVGGFFELPALEKLILQNCTDLIEVCESIEQCDELVHIDLSYCCKVRKLLILIAKVKKVKTLLLDGCISGASKIEMGNMKAIPRDLKSITTSLPGSLITLSLSNSNLCNESFPMDFSCLSILEELYLDGNPIVSMPNYLRTLPKLKRLSMNDCSILVSIENPPRMLRNMSILTSKMKYQSERTKKIKFVQEMSPLRLTGFSWPSDGSQLEIDGMVKIQHMASVDEKVLHSLGWTNLDFIREMRWEIANFWGGHSFECQTKVCYEFGIFNTIYYGEEMPDWINCRSKGSSISLTIPSSPKAKKLQGLNFCCVEVMTNISRNKLPLIKISNTKTNQTWIYKFFHHMNVVVSGKCVCLLSHWMFGPNEMKAGDHITISVATTSYDEQWQVIPIDNQQHTKECGIGLVYDEDGKNKEEEDVLGYYKSWNHIIGGDLSAFQLRTGEYILDFDVFTPYRKLCIDYTPFVEYFTEFKEEELRFKAFSQKNKCDEVDSNTKSKNINTV